MTAWEIAICKIIAERCARKPDDTRPVQPHTAAEEIIDVVKAALAAAVEAEAQAWRGYIGYRERS